MLFVNKRSKQSWKNDLWVFFFFKVSLNSRFFTQFLGNLQYLKLSWCLYFNYFTGFVYSLCNRVPNVPAWWNVGSYKLSLSFNRIRDGCDVYSNRVYDVFTSYILTVWSLLFGMKQRIEFTLNFYYDNYRREYLEFKVYNFLYLRPKLTPKT